MFIWGKMWGWKICGLTRAGSYPLAATLGLVYRVGVKNYKDDYLENGSLKDHNKSVALQLSEDLYI